MKRKREIKRVAVIGSQGVPPKYGGFETLVDNIIINKSQKIEYTVFCSKPDMDNTLTSYKGCQLKYVNLHAHGVMSVPYDIISIVKALKGYDAILILGVSGGIFVPFARMFTRAKLIVNIDGLEHTRDKWSNVAKYFLKLSLGICIRWANTIVSDNKAILDFVKEKYGKIPTLIAYGGNHAIRELDQKRQKSILDFYNLKEKTYDMAICRIEPENNCHITLEAYRESDHNLVMIGNWNHSDYSRELYEKYSSEPGFRLIDSIYELDVLYALRNNMRRYVHGHKSGGTNPSLVEAMFFGKPIMAFDVIYNRETTKNSAYYFKDLSTLKALIERENLDTSKMVEIAHAQYIWESISRQYEALY